MPNQIPKGRRAIVMPSLLRAGGALAPRFTVAPAISGTTAIGDTLTGTITAATASPGGGTVTYAWAWQRGGADIAGASGTTTTVTSYTVVLADAVANSSLARLPLRLRVTATDSNGARTVFSNVLAGPALATDNTLTLTAGDGSTSGTNLLTNDEPAATAITAATFDGETIVLGTPLTLADRGAVTINADGTWSFNDDSDFGDVLLGLSLDRTGTYTNDVGGTATITVTVEGTAERAYEGRVSNAGEFNDASAPTVWALTGTQAPPLTVNNMTRVAGAAGVARLEGTVAASSSLHYAYMFTNVISLFSFDLAIRADGTTGNIGRGVAGGVDALRVYIEGGNIKARLTDGSYDETLTIAKPSGTTFGVSVAVDPVSGKFSLTVSDGDSSAAVAQEVALSGYTAPVISDLYLMEMDGAIFALNLQNPAAVSPAALVTGLESFVGTTYHKAGPTYADPGGLSVAENTTGGTLDVSGGFSAGADASPVYSIDNVTGDWSTVSINSETGVTTYTTGDLATAGSAGATVTVTDDYGQTASDTLAVTVTVGISGPGDISGLEFYLEGATGVTQVANAISDWADQSGNGRNANQTSAAAKPTWVSSNRADFDGSADFMSLSSLPIGNTGVTVMFLVLDQTQSSGGSIWRPLLSGVGDAAFSASGDKWGFGILRSGSSGVGIAHGKDAGSNLATLLYQAADGYTASSALRAVGFRYNSATTTVEIIVDGAVVKSDSSAFASLNTASATGYNLGGESGSVSLRFYDGYIRVFVGYSAALSNADLNDLGDWLSANYGVTWTGVS